MSLSSTLQILRGIKGFEEMEVWVGYHQEEPSGGGYPFHVLGKNLPLEFMSDLMARGLVEPEIFRC